MFCAPTIRARLAVGPDVGGRAGHGHRRAEPRVVRGIGTRILHRLAIVLQPVERQRKPEPADAVRDSRRLMVAAEAVREPVAVAIALREELRRHRRLEPVGLARRQQHGRADRVARIERGKRAVQHVDARDVVGGDQRPARRIRVARAEQVRQQQAVGIDEPARTLQLVEVAPGEHAVAVADVALAHHQVGRVLQRVLGAGVGVRVDLLARDRLDDGRRVGIDALALGGDADGAERVAGRRGCGRGHGSGRRAVGGHARRAGGRIGGRAVDRGRLRERPYESGRAREREPSARRARGEGERHGSIPENVTECRSTRAHAARA